MSDQVNELINSWLGGQILADYNGTVPNKWRVFLEQEGYTFNNLPSTQYRYFEDKDYTGTFNERYKQWLDSVIYV